MSDDAYLDRETGGIIDDFMKAQPGGSWRWVTRRAIDEYTAGLFPPVDGSPLDRIVKLAGRDVPDAETAAEELEAAFRRHGYRRGTDYRDDLIKLSD